MIERLIRCGTKEVVEVELSAVDRLGFPPGTTVIAEEHWNNLKGAVSLPTDTDKDKVIKLHTALKVDLPVTVVGGDK